jgi:membrane associated rhomboid family serine protease
LSTLPIATGLPLADRSRVYVGQAGTQVRHGLILLLLSLLGLMQIHPLLLWYHGGAPPEPKALMTLGCLLFFPLALVRFANAIRGLPLLTVGPQGVALQHALGTKWASWDSIDPFVVETRQTGRRQLKIARARITGPNASRKPSKLISIPACFDEPMEEIVADINTTRASFLGITHMSNAAPADETTVGLSGFAAPWLTFALLAVLIGVFVLENYFPVTPAINQTPSIRTLVAMGALSHAAIFSLGEWYRLFTAPLLHASFAHLAGNGVALLLGGWLLERLVGRLWFFIFFAVGALGGSLASLAIEPANLISVGASGALMGMFAGLFVSSFRIASGNSFRTRLQFSSLRILVPSLLPFLSRSTGMHIDYGAHFGGALAGVVLALILLRLWPENSPIPQARRAAMIIAAISLVLFVGSVGIAIDKYPRYKAALSASSKAPATTDAAINPPAVHPRVNNSTGLLKCSGSAFPSGKGAVPGINCSN